MNGGHILILEREYTKTLYRDCGKMKKRIFLKIYANSNEGSPYRERIRFAKTAVESFLKQGDTLQVSELAEFSRKSESTINNTARQCTLSFTHNSCVMTLRTSNQISNPCILTSCSCTIRLPLFSQLSTRPFIAN